MHPASRHDEAGVGRHLRALDSGRFVNPCPISSKVRVSCGVRRCNGPASESLSRRSAMRIAAVIAWSFRNEVRTRQPISGCFDRIRRHTSIPLPSPSRTSSTATSASEVSIAPTPAAKPDWPTTCIRAGRRHGYPTSGRARVSDRTLASAGCERLTAKSRYAATRAAREAAEHDDSGN